MARKSFRSASAVCSAPTRAWASHWATTASIEAGLYVTAGTKVATPDGKSVKARELSGANNVLFRRNSVTGAVEVVARDGQGITLNEDLHAN